MTHCNSVNIKLINSQLDELKPAIKNETGVTLRLSSKIIGNFNDETNLSHDFLLILRQVSKLRKAFANNLSTDIKLSNTQISKIVQLGGFIGRLLGLLLKNDLLLMKNVLMPLAKSVLIPAGLTAVSSGAEAGIHKRKTRFWN